MFCTFCRIDSEGGVIGITKSSSKFQMTLVEIVNSSWERLLKTNPESIGLLSDVSVSGM